MIPKYRAFYQGKMYAVEAIDFFNEIARLYDIEDNHDIGWIPFSDLILMQSTGLKDKAGINSCCDDLVRSQNGRLWQIKHGHYVWKQPNDEIELYGFYLKSVDDKAKCCCPIYDNFGEIIGNVHQHKSLLEEGK